MAHAPEVISAKMAPRIPKDVGQGHITLMLVKQIVFLAWKVTIARRIPLISSHSHVQKVITVQMVAEMVMNLHVQKAISITELWLKVYRTACLVHLVIIVENLVQLTRLQNVLPAGIV